MALDIAQLVQSYNAGTRALLKAAGLPESMFGDQAAGAAVPTQTPQPPARSAAAVATPQAQFLQGAARYAAKRGGRPGLLEALAQKRSPLLRNGKLSAPVSVVQNPAGGNAVEQLLHIAQHGPRAGQAFQDFDLGGGTHRHVYYDRRGRRTVV
jgi:hypothetical protein